MKDQILYRVLSGKLRLQLGKQTLILDRPTLESKCMAESIYEQMLYEASMFDMLDHDEVLYMMLDAGLWSQEEANELAQLEENIEQLKVKLYEYIFKSRERETGRHLLNLSRDRYRYLLGKRHTYDHLTPEGIAQIAKSHYLICSNLKDSEGNYLWPDDRFLRESFSLLPEIVEEIGRQRIGEADFRSMARNDPWRSIWNIGKKEGKLLGVSPVDYTDDERFLVSWSIVYDNVYESQEPPSNSVIEDDDMLDGWFIIQRRKRENDLLRREGEDMLRNEKIKNAGEVFLPADTIEDAKRVEALNTEQARMAKRQRLAYLKQHGKVSEQEMPDTRQKIMMQYNQAFADSVKGRR